MGMGQFVLIVLGIYTLYYAGNIIYDLYLKKEKVEEEEEQTINIEGIEVSENIENVGIDDVEEMNTPNEFASDEDYLADFNHNEKRETNQSIEELQHKYEEERLLDKAANDNTGEKNAEKKNNGLKKINTMDFQNILNSASSKVSVVKDNDGILSYNYAY